MDFYAGQKRLENGARIPLLNENGESKLKYKAQFPITISNPTKNVIISDYMRIAIIAKYMREAEEFLGPTGVMQFDGLYGLRYLFTFDEPLLPKMRIYRRIDLFFSSKDDGIGIEAKLRIYCEREPRDIDFFFVESSPEIPLEILNSLPPLNR
ncbi:hypothetical protein [Defluviicoccus vanus]|uniref:Uncharacterized protein n=1 Tax=Defluviicoccus vanus TaxID=111831 RepID=A0A7H1MYY7_9PROT|nr:hypothetical protein [Defluviicoccus vanus]QNT68673.1 hypothetical protein HQ394_03955 [Defluviicoccus vanus]